jgi:hypothetical protein
MTSRSTWASYDIDKSLYLINTYEKNREILSYAGASSSKNIFATNADELTALLPSYVFAPDLTMTMAG